MSQPLSYRDRKPGEILKTPDFGPRPQEWRDVWKSDPVLVFTKHHHIEDSTQSNRPTKNRRCKKKAKS